MAGSVKEDFCESDYANLGFAPRDRGIYLQHHRPTAFNAPFHFHPSIEVNFLQGCDMIYSFSGEEVNVKRGHFCVFWAAHPHKALRVSDNGVITNIYVSLSEFLQWRLPGEFVNMLLSGAVLSSKSELDGDSTIAERWAGEVGNTEPKWQRLHALEVQARLSRMALEGWNVLFQPKRGVAKKVIGGNAITHFEKMLRFVALHFCNRITVGDVADAGGVSSNYAISLFGKMLGRTVKGHITDMRIFHAKMMLVETDLKILTIAMDCGFGSLSAFYETFQNRTGVSPAAFRRGAGRLGQEESAIESL